MTRTTLISVINSDYRPARPAHYPNLVLSAGGGFSAASLTSLFDTPSRVWSLGAALAQRQARRQLGG